jgi:hypothetical protein
MGSGVSVPLSKNVIDALDAIGAEQKGDLSDEDWAVKQKELLDANLANIIVFNQIDCDHSGSVSASELKRMLIALPRHGRTVDDGKEPPFVPFESLVETLDSDGDKNITLTEWLTNLQKLEGLVAAIKASVDPATGKLAKCKLLLYALLLL